jgi:hypothetical protein
MEMRNMKRRILIGLAFTGIASVANAHIMPEQASPNPISVAVHFEHSADVNFNFEQAGVASIASVGLSLGTP